MNAGARAGRALAAAAVVICGAGPAGAQVAAPPSRAAAPAPAPRSPPPIQPGQGTARSVEMQMTSYDIMMPGRDMPPELRKKMKTRR